MKKLIGFVSVLFAFNNLLALSLTGDIVLVSSPSDARDGKYESNSELRFWVEKNNYVLGSNVAVDVTAPGSYGSGQALTAGTISSGTVVNSYYLHFDPIGSSSTVIGPLSGQIEFDTPILGVIVTRTRLSNSNNQLGAAGTLYGVSPFELNTGTYADLFTVSGNKLMVSLDALYANTGVDNMRIITATPEPGTVMLLGFGLLFIGFIKRYRK